MVETSMINSVNDSEIDTPVVDSKQCKGANAFHQNLNDFALKTLFNVIIFNYLCFAFSSSRSSSSFNTL